MMAVLCTSSQWQPQFLHCPCPPRWPPTLQWLDWVQGKSPLHSPAPSLHARDPMLELISLPHERYQFQRSGGATARLSHELANTPTLMRGSSGEATLLNREGKVQGSNFHAQGLPATVRQINWQSSNSQLHYSSLQLSKKDCSHQFSPSFALGRESWGFLHTIQQNRSNRPKTLFCKSASFLLIRTGFTPWLSRRGVTAGADRYRSSSGCHHNNILLCDAFDAIAT